MSSFYTRAALGLSLALAPLAVLAQTSPFDPGTSRSSIAEARSTDPLLPPSQVPGKYRRYLSKRHSNDREAKAVLHMVGRKRTWGTIWSVVALSNTIRLFGSYEPVTTVRNGKVTTTEQSPVGNIVVAGVCWPLGIARWSRYNNQKLYQAFMQYEAGQGFPAYMDSNIKDKDYDR